MTNIYDFRDFRKKWEALQESWNTKVRENAVQMNNQEELEAGVVDEEVNSMRGSEMNDALDAMLDAYEAAGGRPGRGFSAALQALDQFVQQNQINFTEEEIQMIQDAFYSLARKSVTRDQLPEPFNSVTKLDEARRKKKTEKKSKKSTRRPLTNTDKDEEVIEKEKNSGFDKLDKLLVNSVFNEEDEAEDDLDEDDETDALDQLDKVVLASRYGKKECSVKEDDDDLEEDVTSGDVGGDIANAVPSRLGIRGRRGRLGESKEVKEIDDEKIEADIQADQTGDEVAEDDVTQVIQKLQSRFPGKKILITVEAGDEKFDAQTVQAAQDILSAGAAEDEVAEDITGEEDVEEVQSSIFSKGKKVPVQKESAYIRILRKVLKEAKEELDKIETEVSKETEEKEEEASENTEEPAEGAIEVGNAPEEQVSDQAITLSVQNWKAFLDKSEE